jgi:polar amino acid transport system substrate-binding protein
MPARLRLFAPLLLLAAALFAHSPLFAADSAARSFDQIIAAKRLRVGVSLMVPYTMQGKNGELVGSEIDVAQRLAKDMGVSVEFKSYAWEQLIPALRNGEIDIIAAGMSITPARALQVWFSQPYASSGIGLATNTALTREFDSLDALNDPKVAIGVLGDTVSEQLARELFEQASIKRFSDEKQLEEALVKGLVHAYVRSEPAPRFLALRHPKEVDVPIARPLVETREAFAVRRGDSDFINFLNAWIEARSADAWLPSTRQYWFEGLSWRDRVAP